MEGKALMTNIIFQAAATPGNTAAAAELTAQLKSIGVTADTEGGFLTIHIDYDKFNSVTKRKAGRKGQAAQHGAELLTIPAVYQYAQEHTAAETARYCRLSLRTYQRRVAEYKKLNIWSAAGGEQYKYF